MVSLSPRLGILFSNYIKQNLYIYDSKQTWDSSQLYLFKSKPWSQVTEVYSNQLSLKVHVLPTFTTGYNLVRNGTKVGHFQWTFNVTLKHRS